MDTYGLLGDVTEAPHQVKTCACILALNGPLTKPVRVRIPLESETLRKFDFEHHVDPVCLVHATLRALGCLLRRRRLHHARGHDHDKLGDPLLHASSVAGSLRLPLDG